MAAVAPLQRLAADRFLLMSFTALEFVIERGEVKGVTLVKDEHVRD
jgi:hypothetical protein